MSKIKSVRPVLLSAPYADPLSNAEVIWHLTSGYRTCGMVEIELENGIKGLGEGYLAVFAPKVFTSSVDLLAKYVVGREIADVDEISDDLVTASGYWSLQGAARHVLSAFEIALIDCASQQRKVPAYEYLGGKNKALPLYGSGGDSINPKAMNEEMRYLKGLGIRYFKIRARSNNINKAVWTIKEARNFDIQVAVDMTQNLANPGQTIDDVLSFEKKLIEQTGDIPFFLEEVLGMAHVEEFPELSQKAKSSIAGGEIVTTEGELIKRINAGYYQIVQPDATVLGGIRSVMRVFEAAGKKNINTVVHNWGGAVCMMANYHAAIAANATLAEWPMPQFVLRDEMVKSPWDVRDGNLYLTDVPGLGVRLTREIEKKYAFRQDALYNCLLKHAPMLDDDIWK